MMKEKKKSMIVNMDTLNNQESNGNVYNVTRDVKGVENGN